MTVLIPARNEAGDIGRCLSAVAATDLPLAEVEVVVVDGSSTDGTAAVAQAALDGIAFGRAQVLTNAEGSTPANLNAGLAAASGRYVCRVDARSIIPPGYVRRCVEVLEERAGVVAVGGRQYTVARDDSVVARGIARGLNNKWGMGFSRYRRGAASGPTDTVYLGAFRTEQVRAVGGWDERFATNQDFELNRRLGRQGTVWFAADLVVGYLPRPSLRSLVRQYHRFGRWKVRYWRLTHDRPRPRQLVLLAAPPVVTAASLVALTQQPRRIRWLLPAGIGAAVAVDHVAGEADPAATPAIRAVAIATLMATSAGWLSGIVREATRRR